MLDIENDAIYKQLRAKFGKVIVENSNEYRVCCPMCAERAGKRDAKFKLYINPTKVHTENAQLVGTWHCFRCEYRGWGLHKLDIIIKIPKIPIKSGTNLLSAPSQPTSHINVYGKVKLNLQKTASPPQQHKLRLPQSYTQRFSGVLGAAAYKYLQQRNVTPTQITDYKIGYCPKGPYQGHVVFPIYENKQLSYFVTRSIFTKLYKNAPVKNNGILFNYQQQNVVILVEGIFDALALGNHGVALLGKTLKLEQLHKFLKHPPTTLFILLDTDAKNSALTIANKLRSYVKDIRIAQPPTNKDPGMLSRSQLKKVLQKATPLGIQNEVSFLYAD